VQKTAGSSTQLSTTGRCGRRRASSSDIGGGEWPDEDSAQELRIDGFLRVRLHFLLVQRALCTLTRSLRIPS
jgi:hypothetical protein